MVIIIPCITPWDTCNHISCLGLVLFNTSNIYPDLGMMSKTRFYLVICPFFFMDGTHWKRTNRYNYKLTLRLKPIFDWSKRRETAIPSFDFHDAKLVIYYRRYINDAFTPITHRDVITSVSVSIEILLRGSRVVSEYLKIN